MCRSLFDRAARSAAASYFRRCIEEDFDAACGKTTVPISRPSITTPPCGAKLLLRAPSRRELRGRCHARSCVGDGRIADQAGDVFVVEQHAVFFFARLEADGGFGGELFESHVIAQRQFVSQGLQCERAIHGAGFEIQQAELARKMSGDGAFACSGRTVDGDDDPAVR